MSDRASMRLLATLAFAVVSLTGSMAIAEPEEDRISTRQTGEDSYEIKLESKTVFDLPSARRRIVPVAQELCAGRFIRPGRYTFDKSEAVSGSDADDWFQMVQIIRCVDSAPERPASTRKKQLKSEADIEAARNRVQILSGYYFDKLYEMLGNDASAVLSALGGDVKPDFSAIRKTEADTIIRVNLFKLTVYDNLPTAPSDGVYVAVDYDNRVGNVAHHCGYLMWHSPDGVEFKLGRTESGLLDAELLESMSEQDIYSARKQLRCANVYDE